MRQRSRPRPSHPAPRFVTTAKRLWIERGTAQTKARDLPDAARGLFFAGRLDMNSENQHVGQISDLDDLTSMLNSNGPPAAPRIRAWAF
jgi:hypothetical protein